MSRETQGDNGGARPASPEPALGPSSQAQGGHFCPRVLPCTWLQGCVGLPTVPACKLNLWSLLAGLFREDMVSARNTIL